MDLIVFAHRGEAQSFLKNLTAHNENFYLGAEYNVLITGEGIWEACKIASHLRDIDRVINFGVAGALNSELELNTIYPIRTHYLYEQNKPQFKSYTNLHPSTFDCITSFERVLKKETQEKLSCFAQIVDRESWLMAKIAKDQQMPFLSFKLISDYASEQTQCFDIKGQAKIYSDQLFAFYQTSVQKQAVSIDSPKELPFACSFSHQKKIEKLLRSLNTQTGKDSAYYIDRYGIPKNKKEINGFIQKLEEELNPFLAKVRKRLNAIQQPFEAIGAQILFDPRLEQKKIQLRMEINSTKNIENLIAALQELEFTDIEQVWSGDV